MYVAFKVAVNAFSVGLFVSLFLRLLPSQDGVISAPGLALSLGLALATGLVLAVLLLLLRLSPPLDRVFFAPELLDGVVSSDTSDPLPVFLFFFLDELSSSDELPSDDSGDSTSLSVPISK